MEPGVADPRARAERVAQIEPRSEDTGSTHVCVR